MAEAGETAKGFVGDDKVRLDWQAPRENRPKQQVKLLLNMLLIGLAGIPRGGMVRVEAAGGGFTVRARGERAKLPEALAEVIEGRADLASLDARLVQPYYARLLAQSAGLKLSHGDGRRRRGGERHLRAPKGTQNALKARANGEVFGDFSLHLPRLSWRASAAGRRSRHASMLVARANPRYSASLKSPRRNLWMRLSASPASSSSIKSA